jgi:hypothetical protein
VRQADGLGVRGTALRKQGNGQRVPPGRVLRCPEVTARQTGLRSRGAARDELSSARTGPSARGPPVEPPPRSGAG